MDLSRIFLNFNSYSSQYCEWSYHSLKGPDLYHDMRDFLVLYIQIFNNYFPAETTSYYFLIHQRSRGEKLGDSCG